MSTVQNTISRVLNSQSVLNIINDRKKALIVDETLVGSRLKLTVQSIQDIVVVTKDGTPVMSVQDPTKPLEKRIITVRGFNGVASKNPVIKAYLAKGLECEQAGDVEGASENFREYLNRTQLSVGVLHPLSPALQWLAKGDQIKGTLMELTPENTPGIAGNLITMDSKGIGVIPVLDAAAFGSNEKLTVDDLLNA